jgi:predicted nuclease of predicted toxin-antitoxin system
LADLYVDQNIDRRVVLLLEAAGHRVTTPAALSLRRGKDPQHLAVAAQNGWIFITHDRDFLALHRIWMAWTAGGCIVLPHAGILRLPRVYFQDVFRQLDSFLQQRPIFPNELWNYDPSPTLGWYRPPA